MKDDLRKYVTEKNNTATGKKIEREKIKKELRQEVRIKTRQSCVRLSVRFQRDKESFGVSATKENVRT